VSVEKRDRVEALYREQGARLWRSVFAFTADREVANDAVAEAFAQLLRRGNEVREPRGWVWKSAFRIAAGELKRRSRERSQTIEGTYEFAESSGILGALGQLSPTQRAAVVLHHYGGYPVKDIAAILSSTAPAIRVHLSRGRKRLRGFLEDEDYG
jgi:RNA polymerase sigma-70 factor (ECF subfamily)